MSGDQKNIEPLSHEMGVVTNSHVEALCDTEAAQHFAEEEDTGKCKVNDLKFRMDYDLPMRPCVPLRGSWRRRPEKDAMEK